MILEENPGNIDGSKELEISFASNETVLMGDVPAVADKEEVVPVAQGEGKQPISLLNDRFCEELPIHICLLLNNLVIMSSVT